MFFFECRLFLINPVPITTRSFYVLSFNQPLWHFFFVVTCHIIVINGHVPDMAVTGDWISGPCPMSSSRNCMWKSAAQTAAAWRMPCSRNFLWNNFSFHSNLGPSTTSCSLTHSLSLCIHRSRLSGAKERFLTKLWARDVNSLMERKSKSFGSQIGHVPQLPFCSSVENKWKC